MSGLVGEKLVDNRVYKKKYSRQHLLRNIFSLLAHRAGLNINIHGRHVRLGDIYVGERAKRVWLRLSSHS